MKYYGCDEVWVHQKWGKRVNVPKHVIFGGLRHQMRNTHILNRSTPMKCAGMFDLHWRRIL